ncbi:hypothetical protein GQ53DRAFT_872606 [Thozetella sp. PMI_491]|nr:hypothetical protein GQ53DRAFT_872606 [Thozetella sp. PMI_491]
MTTVNSVVEVFEEAKQSFRRKLKNPRLYDEILTTTSISDVYESTARLQEGILGKGRLRNLGKIRPFLDCIDSYAKVIEVFVGAKPELLALIWGPIKLVLRWSSEINIALDRITDIMEKIGRALPQFTRIMDMFGETPELRATLALFYEDLLDFHRITLEFFRKPSNILTIAKEWKQMFEILWPRHSKEIDVVIGNIEKHAVLLRSETTILEIMEAHEARIQSFSHFEKTNSFQEHQKFLALQSRISPVSYDERLDCLRNRSVPGCANWLFRDYAFKNWLDFSSNAKVWFWLQGIPGAGKTYLSAVAIDHVKAKYNTLFAFLSYTHKSCLTALSVIHSLIFQAADDNKDFQDLLVESKVRELQGSTRYAASLLQGFLKTAGPTYIILDGLDEIDDAERCFLLKHLDEFSKECDKLRLLISSRAEDDISKMLHQKSETVRVNDRNHGSIQNYVDHRSENWMHERQFDLKTKSEMLVLLSPLSANAKDHLQQLNSIEDIRRELRALPTDLTDAYHRIFQRINDAKSPVRDKCRNVLGWIGCAPIPLTVPEMEQALLVDTNPLKSLTEVPKVIGSVNFVQMCGPIVEIMDGRLQFVHFTVSEYIFSMEIKDFIDRAKASQRLAMSLLAYLSAAVLEPDLDDEEVIENILTGKYRLFEYASFYWSVLVRTIQDNQDSSRQLGMLLERVIENGRNDNFDDRFEGDSNTVELVYKNNFLHNEILAAYDMTCAVLKFRSNEKRWNWNLGNRNSWEDLDPLTTSKRLVNIRERYDALLRDEDNHTSLRFHYGINLFKCTYPFCVSSRWGFKSKGNYEAHIKDHGRVWKCSLQSCDFSWIGFGSKKSRDEHWMKYHLVAARQLQEGSNDFDKLDPEDSQPILFRLVIDDDIERVQLLLSSKGGKRLKAEVIAGARQYAVGEHGSLAMIKLLAPEKEKYVPFDILKSALKTGYIDLVKWVLPRTKASNYIKPDLTKAMLGIESNEIYALWEDHILLKLDEMGEGPRDRGSDFRVDDIFSNALFSSAKEDGVKEARLKSTLRKLKQHMQPNTLGNILVRIANTSCSLALAKEVISLGAPINPTYGFTSGRTTALRAAARQTTQAAAILMQFLILNGARTESLPTEKDIGTEIGALQIAKWLGVTWEELVEEYQRDWLNRILGRTAGANQITKS